MDLIYDITVEPIMWSTLYLIWFAIGVILFIQCIASLGNVGTDKQLISAKNTYRIICVVLLSLGAAATVFGISKRADCIELASDESHAIEGHIEAFTRSIKANGIRFKVGYQSFVSQSPLLHNCGFVRSANDVVALNEGDYVKIVFDQGRILKLWRAPTRARAH
jgi:hypothetical protein